MSGTSFRRESELCNVFFRDMQLRLGIFAELFAFLWRRKLWWLILPDVSGLVVEGEFLAGLRVEYVYKTFEGEDVYVLYHYVP